MRGVAGRDAARMNERLACSRPCARMPAVAAARLRASCGRTLGGIRHEPAAASYALLASRTVCMFCSAQLFSPLTTAKRE